MAGKKTEDIVRCSFCNKTQSQVRKMIAEPISVMTVLLFVPRLLRKN